MTSEINLFSSIKLLPNINNKIASRLTVLLEGYRNIEDPVIADLLHYLPRAYVVRKRVEKISDAAIGDISILKLHVKNIISSTTRFRSKKGNYPKRIICTDGKDNISITYFANNITWLAKQFDLTHGSQIVVSGKVSLYKSALTIVHPDYLYPIQQEHLIPEVEPIYSLISGVTNKGFRSLIKQALELIPDFDEWIDRDFYQIMKFDSYKNSLLKLHNPTKEDLKNSVPYQRLAYDELFAHQLALKLLRQKKALKDANAIPSGININLKTSLSSQLISKLPYKLTSEQTKALEEICDDLKSTTPMSRLLQGDVGCGKTIVATLAMLNVVESGYQAAIMVPTEVLAKQHFNNISKLLADFGINVVMLTRKEKVKERNEIRNKISSGEAQIIIGTHALLQPDISFKSLALTVIDEQHKFGVKQRNCLNNKSIINNLLIMTATPIPRTLVLTEFGDTDLSQIKEKPVNRLPIKTSKLSTKKLPDLLERIKLALDKGEKIYWICPLIEESEYLELNSVLSRFEELEKIFGEKVGLLHGKMTAEEKSNIINNFKNGVIKILVATTVIEVGIDIPDASIIIIEHAEHFGLSQLHQLRGRVGRGTLTSKCLLLYKEPISKTAAQRLAVMCNSNDGFYIAEQDLLLRGEGEIFGTRQSGAINFMIANINKHQILLEHAYKTASHTHTKINGEQLEIPAQLTTLLKLHHLDVF